MYVHVPPMWVEQEISFLQELRSWRKKNTNVPPKYEDTIQSTPNRM